MSWPPTIRASSSERRPRSSNSESCESQPIVANTRTAPERQPPRVSSENMVEHFAAGPSLGQASVRVNIGTIWSDLGLDHPRFMDSSPSEALGGESTEDIGHYAFGSRNSARCRHRRAKPDESTGFDSAGVGYCQHDQCCRRDPPRVTAKKSDALGQLWQRRPLSCTLALLWNGSKCSSSRG